MTAMWLRRNVELHLGAVDSATMHAFHANGHVVDAEPRGETAEPGFVQPHVDERAERHVACDTAERLEDGDRHSAERYYLALRASGSIGRPRACVEQHNFSVLREPSRR